MITDDLATQRMAMGARLREAREYLGLSQEEVATVLKLSRPAVTNIESGSRKIESLELEQLSKLYGNSIDYFLTGEKLKEESSAKVAFAARALQGLSQRDLDEVARFANYLRTTGDAKALRSKK